MRNWESKAFKKTGILRFCSRLDPRIKPGLTSGIRHQIPALLPENPLPTLVPRFRGNSRDSPPGREFGNSREWNSRGAGKAGFSRLGRAHPDPFRICHPWFPTLREGIGIPGSARCSRTPTSCRERTRKGWGGNSKEFSGKRGGSSGFPFGKNSGNFPSFSSPLVSEEVLEDEDSRGEQSAAVCASGASVFQGKAGMGEGTFHREYLGIVLRNRAGGARIPGRIPTFPAGIPARDRGSAFPFPFPFPLWAGFCSELSLA